MKLEFVDHVEKKIYVSRDAVTFNVSDEDVVKVIKTDPNEYRFNDVGITTVICVHETSGADSNLLTLARAKLNPTVTSEEISKFIRSEHFVNGYLVLEDGNLVRACSYKENERAMYSFNYTGPHTKTSISINTLSSKIFGGLLSVGMNFLDAIFIMAEKYSSVTYPINVIDYSDPKEIKKEVIHGPSKEFIERFPKLMKPKLEAMRLEIDTIKK